MALVARNFVNADIIGSLEFGTNYRVQRRSWCSVMLCGAIKGAVDNAKLGNLNQDAGVFRRAIAASRGVAGDRSSKNTNLVQAVADNNARIAAKMLLNKSAVLRELVQRKELIIRLPCMTSLPGR